MRELQPELKKIKAAAKGDRATENRMTMELYKEKEINPAATFGIVIVQLPILIGLYSSIRRLITNPHSIVTFSYGFVRHLGWIQTLSHNIHRFDSSLFGLVNLTRTASGHGVVYWPAMAIVAASALAQYLQSKQLMPENKDQRSLRTIMREAGSGRSTDQADVNAAISRWTIFFIPAVVFFVSLNLAVALPLYWLVSSTVAYLQQARVIEKDVTEAEEVADKPVKPKPQTTETKGGLKVTHRTLSQNKKTASKKNKRRKR